MSKLLLSAFVCWLFLPSFAGAQSDPPAIVFDSTIIYQELEVYFDFGESTLRPDADSLIRELMQTFNHRDKAEFLVQAHTDAIGSDAANDQLARSRADSVAAYLETLGVQTEQIRIEAFGESRPQAENDSEEGRQRNRRAVIRVQEVRKMYWIEGQVVDPETGEGFPAELVIRYKEKVDSARTDTTGFFRLPVPDYSVISIEAFATGYYFSNEMMRTDHASITHITLSVPKVKIGMIVPLNHFYFRGNMDELLPRSKPELHRLLRFLQINPDVRIEIAGHVNRPNELPVPVTSWSYDLSVRRALRVYDYLVEQGIESSRLSYIGFGNWNMRFPQARTEQQQELNRRVEIRILGDETVISREDPLLSDWEFLRRRLDEWKELEESAKEEENK